MDAIIMFPKVCRKGIRTLTDTIGVSLDTAYNMMLTTATLMDLRPEDERVVEMILRDCGMEVHA